MIKLSVVIITFNEERNISRCLDSVKDVADEIVVVDSFSTDKTREICESRNVRFIEHKFEGHIEQKNYAMNQASYDYILSLDADEALSDELKTSILEVKKDWTHDGYTFNRFTNYCGKWIRHSGWYPDVKLRLWDRRKGKWQGVNPHDKCVLEPGAKVKHLKGDLLHYSYYTIEEHILQANKFSTIAAEQLVKKKKHVPFIKVLINPFFKFLRNYFLKAGFLDGYYGFIICTITAHETFQKYAKAWHLARSGKK